MIPRLLPLLAGLALAAGLRADPGDLAPAQPAIPSRTFNLADFGAAADGRTPCTAAFARAIEAVRQAGGGTLAVPKGIFLTGPIKLCSGLKLQLFPGALIQFSPLPADYRHVGTRLEPQISAAGLHDVEISGYGAVIDGHGEIWWPAAQAMRDPVTGQQLNGHTTPRPPMIVFVRCRRVRVEGVALRNSPALNLGINDTSDATVMDVAVSNPADSPNTDGIDPKGAQRVLISHCRVDTGDDCIAAGGGRGDMPEQDILITDCQFFHGHGCSIGSGTASGVRRMTVRRCSFDGTDTGIRMKSARDRGGIVEDLLYTDLTMKNVGHAISLNGHYSGTTTDTAIVDHDPAQPVTATTPNWHRIVIRNVTSLGGLVDAGLIVGLPEAPVQDILFDHVRIEAPRGLQLGYVDGIVLRDTRIAAQSGPSLIVSPTVKHLVQQP